MDGAALLQEVSIHHPEVIRIILSGHAELETALRAVPVAHQFLTKPCTAGVLEETVTRALRLYNTLNNKLIRKIVGKLTKLPSVPRVYSEVTKALVDPSTNAKDIGRIIQQDPAMSVKVLQLVNSSFFARAVRITDVAMAVVNLGFQMIKTLVLSVEIFQSFKTDPGTTGFSIEEFQHHALYTAANAKNILSDSQQAGDAFTAAMLHDIGKLILASRAPEIFASALNLSNNENLPLFVAEYQQTGISHAEIGAYLLGLWGLPYPIIEAVANHHNPAKLSKFSSFGVPEAVYLANCLAADTAVDREYIDSLGLAQKLDSWSKMAKNLRVI